MLDADWVFAGVHSQPLSTTLCTFYKNIREQDLTGDSYIWLGLIVVITIFLATTIRVVKENERFAVNRMGRFIGFRGPGLVLKMMSHDDWVRISSGDRGEVVAFGLAKFKGIDLPVEAQEPVRIGDFIRITGFSENKVLAVRDTNQTRTIACEKCGHPNIVT